MSKFDSLVQSILEAVDTTHQVGGEHWGGLLKDATIKRKNIDWKENYGKKFKLVRTPQGKQTGKWTKGQISIVTPTNEKAWSEWPDVSKEDYLRFKNNWRNIQKSLSDDKYLQITEK